MSQTYRVVSDRQEQWSGAALQHDESSGLWTSLPRRDVGLVLDWTGAVSPKIRCLATLDEHRPDQPYDEDEPDHPPRIKTCIENDHGEASIALCDGERRFGRHVPDLRQCSEMLPEPRLAV